MGREGGRAVLKKYGKQHFAEIGRRGFDALVNKWFGGNKDEAILWLHGQQSERQIDRLLTAKHEAQIADGASIVCTEMPVFCSPDDDPFFPEESTYWQDRVTGKGNGRRK